MNHWGILAVLAVVIVLVVARLRSRRLTPEQFMEAVRVRIADKYPNIQLESQADFGWKCQVNGRSSQIGLHNVYAMYLRLPSRYRDTIDEFLTGLGAMGSDDDVSWDDVKHRVFPSIKPDGYFHAIREMPGASELADSLLLYDFVEGLKIMMVIDLGQSMRMVSIGELEQWNVSKAALADQAMRNLAASTAPLWVSASEAARKQGLLMFNSCDGYDASRVLLPDFCERACRALGCERVVVAIPRRDLLVAYDADKTDIQGLKTAVADECANGGYGLTSGLIFLPPDSKPNA